MKHNFANYRQPKQDKGPLEVIYRVLVNPVEKDGVMTKNKFDTFNGQKIIDYGN